MKQMIRIICKVDIEKQYEQILLCEQDYELLTLFNAMQQQDKTQMDKSKKRLAEIHEELQGLRAYA